MANEKRIPLEYCTPARAARLLGCELEDIYHWYEIGAINIYIKLDEDGEKPCGGSGFECKQIYFEGGVPGTICYQGDFGTTDTEDTNIWYDTLYKHGTNVIFLISEKDEYQDDSDTNIDYVQADYTKIWIKLDKFAPPINRSDDTLEGKLATCESSIILDYITYRVWLSGLHEVSIPFSYLREGFRVGFENIEKIESIDMQVNIGSDCISIMGADIEHAVSLFRVRYDDLSRLRDGIASGNSLSKQPRKLLTHPIDPSDTSPRVTANQSKAIVDLLKALGYTSADLQGSTEALQQKIARNGHSKQLSSVTPKTLRAWLNSCSE
ncbi:hypothetical protein [Aeromonas salmonicida]|uniref:hypothetical protein n=1 Tax=Aeromonas salmonicida TaxID=645 RepID=UPI000AF04C5A|nr:hypothetical protein [Aeromonas salmonicida]